VPSRPSSPRKRCCAGSSVSCSLAVGRATAIRFTLDARALQH
jgi:hypothetical protein